MARLNDYAAPPESVEALKRRFVRQNREIARVNSMQSLRIRSLESEVSHLLAENVSLREQVINLTQEIERLEAVKGLHNGVYEIKSRLDSKLAELSNLASELGMLPRRAGKLDGGKSNIDPNCRKATAPDLKARTAESEHLTEIDYGRLPPILENKYYPRRTLEAQEIQNLVQTDSSLLGTPQPGVMDVYEDDCAQPHGAEVIETLPESHTDETTSPEALLPPTLETRKRKKKADTMTIDSGYQPPCTQPIFNEGTAHLTKSGAKRKFSPDDDGFLPDLSPDHNEFQFSRAHCSPRKSTPSSDLNRKSPSPSKTSMSTQQSSANLEPAKRKVLEPKSANLSLGSPRKVCATSNSDKIAHRIDRDGNAKSSRKPKENENHVGKPLTQKRSDRGLQQENRSSQSIDLHEAAQSQSQDTLAKDSPAENLEECLLGMSEGTTTSRPSRRRGAVVSYAEPNLRDKMRRPTKELIDAVGKHGTRRSSSFQVIHDSMGEEGEKSQRSRNGISPRPPSARNFPADLTLADQATDIFSAGGDGNQLFAAVSRRKRKTSSNVKDSDVHTGLDSGDPSAATLIFKAPHLSNRLSKTSGEALNSRRQSRRHSSNPKNTTDSASPRKEVNVNNEPQSPLWNKSPIDMASLAQNDDGLDEEISGQRLPVIDAEARRETRVATRRKSMMV
ncbi:uncharacterized protein N7459_003708 [Penicillium hispanicum]|uniref:uncharacterized protein n=1 Tax=Penicillium hispanicum TaxID=1080232 RepID=UPI0025416200|nr:uncharacterized protein N7459_003708 [Penicillium hispanicum]KAJ5587943.1 hypothetical protein N7459_003708 [Penicillium hispanicum]